jgi:hypothetical protein
MQGASARSCDVLCVLIGEMFGVHMYNRDSPYKSILAYSRLCLHFITRANVESPIDTVLDMRAFVVGLYVCASLQLIVSSTYVRGAYFDLYLTGSNFYWNEYHFNDGYQPGYISKSNSYVLPIANNPNGPSGSFPYCTLVPSNKSPTFLIGLANNYAVNPAYHPEQYRVFNCQNWFPASKFTFDNPFPVDPNSANCQLGCNYGYVMRGGGSTVGQVSCFVDPDGDLYMEFDNYYCLLDATYNISPITGYNLDTSNRVISPTYPNGLLGPSFYHVYTFSMVPFFMGAYCPINVNTLLLYWSPAVSKTNATRFKALGNCALKNGFMIANDVGCTMGCLPQFTIQYSDFSFYSAPMYDNGGICIRYINNKCVEYSTYCTASGSSSATATLHIPDYTCGYQYAPASCPVLMCVGNAAGGLCTDGCGVPIQVTATNTATEGYCTQCANGWGPPQARYCPYGTPYLDAVQTAARYLYQYCSVPFGPSLLPTDITVVGYQRIAKSRECNGVGLFVMPAVIIAMFSITSNGSPLPASAFLAYNSIYTAATNFDTHPSNIQNSLYYRYGSNFDSSAAALENYNQQIYTVDFTPHPSCVYCDPGYTPYGASCIVDTSTAWTKCHITDRACTLYMASQSLAIGNYWTGLVCGQMMYNGAGYILQRGQRMNTMPPLVLSVYCQCADGYAGNDCGEVRCAWSNGLSCSSNGYCDEPSNRCICASGWVGAACEIPLANCNAPHGQTRIGNPPATNNPQGYAVPAGAQVPNAYLLTQTVWY